MQRDWEQAARSGDAATIDRLAAAGADLDSRDAHGQTALMVAARLGHVDVVTRLIARGADLNHAAKYHLTAAMLAVLNGHGDIARRLAAAGADLSARGSGAPGFAGLTASDLAAARGELDLAGVLRPDRVGDE